MADNFEFFFFRGQFILIGFGFAWLIGPGIFSRGYEFSSEESEGEEDNRKVKDDSLNSSSPEGRVKGENENRENESSCEESVGEEDNREVKDDPLNSRSPEGRDKGEGESREYESSCEESVGEKNKMDKRDTGEPIEEEGKGVEVNIGNCVTEEEEDGTVTVLKTVQWGNV